MKQTFKFAMAALAVVGLASCSSDDFFGNGENAQLKKNGISVTVDDMVDPATMRSAIAPVGEGQNNQWYWQKGDQIRMYDETLGKYDDYTCNENGEFVLTLPEGATRTGAAIKEPKYALFYNGGTATGTTNAELKWDAKTDQLYANFTIPTNIAWSEQNVGEGNDVEAYLSYLPLWGEAYPDETYGVGATLHYLTAVIRLDLKNVPGNANFITVEGWVNDGANADGKAANVTGTYTAVLSELGAAPTKETVKLDPETGTNTGNKIIVDISQAKRDQSVVYVPMISQKYKTVKMQAWASWNDWTTSAEPVATEVKENVTLNHGTVYPIDLAKFDIAGGDITSINDALQKRTEDEGTVTIKASKVTEVKANDYILKIPNMKANEVVIDLKGLNAEQNQDLHIVYLDEENPYEGNLVIDVDKNNLSFSNRTIYVDLPRTRVTFSGAGLQYTKLGDKDETSNLNVKQLTIGPALNPGEDGTDLTKVQVAYVNAQVGTNNTTTLEDVIISEGATLGTLILKGGKDTTVETIAIQGTLTDRLDVSTGMDDKVITITVGDKANITKGFVTNQTKVTIPGKAYVSRDQTVTFNAIVLAEGGDVVVNGKAIEDESEGAKVEGTIQIVGKGTFTVKGASNVTALEAVKADGAEATGVTTVTVANTSVVDVIETPDADVTFSNTAKSTNKVTAKTLTMNGKTSVCQATVTGDVTIANNGENVAVTSRLTMNTGDQTLTLTGGYINAITAKNLKVVNEEVHQTAIKSVSSNALAVDEDGNTYTSVWCGKTISNDYAAYAKAVNIYTASHLASLAKGTAAAELKVNIDLNSKNWPMIALEQGFNGGKKTIKNLRSIHRDADNVGLFSTVAEGCNIWDLTIENATVTGLNNVGALAGNLLGGLTISNVTVQKGENQLLIQTDQQADEVVGENIGGVVGYAVGNTVFKNVAVTGAVIKGKYNLGGIIGQGQNVNIQSSQDQINLSKFAVNGAENLPFYGREDADLKAGSVGVYAGNVRGLLEVDAKHQKTGDWMTNKRGAYGFRANYYMTMEDGKLKYYTYYGSYTGDAGICGSYQVGTAVNSTTDKYFDDAATLIENEGINAYIKDIINVPEGTNPTESGLKY